MIQTLVILVTWLAFISGAAAQPSGAVAVYSFNDRRPSDEVSGDTASLVGTRWAADRFGNRDHAVYVRGDMFSYISLGTHPRLRPREGTISLWVNLDNAVHAGRGFYSNPIVFTKNGNGNDFFEGYSIALALESEKFASSQAFDSTRQVVIFSLDTVQYGEWYHLALSYNDEQTAFYINGHLVDRSPKHFESRFEQGDSVLLGHSNNEKNNRFARGTFDDVYIYDRVLSDAEIAALYDAPNPSQAAVMMEYLKWVVLVGTFAGLLLFGTRWQLSRVHAREKQMLMLQNLQLETELRVNRALMNPHFVFNSLNTLQNFILKNKNDRANKYLVRFSKLIRRVLETNLANSITIDTEIELLNRYLEIEDMRFDDNIRHEITVAPEVSPALRIPVMMVQPFVENAIWHGLLKKEGEKLLKVSFSRLNDAIVRCTVDDNGHGRKPVTVNETGNKSLATGFIEQRLSLLNKIHKLDCRLEFHDKPGNGGTVVTIDLPILT